MCVCDTHAGTQLILDCMHMQVAQFLITTDFVAFFKDPANKEAIYKYPNNFQAQEMHALVLVGYHLDFSDFSKSYWVVKNSW